MYSNPVRGRVSARLNLFDDDMVWPDVVGLRVDSAFIEHHLVACESFRGHTGTGPQEVELVGMAPRGGRTLNDEF